MKILSITLVDILCAEKNGPILRTLSEGILYAYLLDLLKRMTRIRQDGTVLPVLARFIPTPSFTGCECF